MKLSAAQMQEAFSALMGQKCKCGAKKPQGQPFCVACLDKLPAPLQSALFEHLLHNFNERYFEAVKCLEESTQQSAVIIHLFP